MQYFGNNEMSYVHNCTGTKSSYN